MPHALHRVSSSFITPRAYLQPNLPRCGPTKTKSKNNVYYSIFNELEKPLHVGMSWMAVLHAPLSGRAPGCLENLCVFLHEGTLPQPPARILHQERGCPHCIFSCKPLSHGHNPTHLSTDSFPAKKPSCRPCPTGISCPAIKMPVGSRKL